MRAWLARLTWLNLERALVHPPHGRGTWDWVRIGFLGFVVLMTLIVFIGTFDAFSTIARNFWK
jgi:hypothetical protein